MGRIKALATAGAFALLLAAPTTLNAAPTAQAAALSAESLANATYAIDYVPGSPITLTDGTYENAADRVHVVLQPLFAYGDATRDSVDDVAVLMASNTGGSGTFIQLIVMADDGGQPTQVASSLLGDRVDVQELAIDEGLVIVTMVQQGPTDPMCCPSQNVKQAYVVDGDQLTLVAEEVQASDAAALTDEALANATYQSEYVESGEVTLTDGVYHVEPAAGEVGPRVHVELVEEWNTYGDLNGDGVDDAAVILSSNTGGSGVFFDVAAVLNQGGEPQHVASAFLGDRVVINSLAITDGTIVVDMIQQAADDPLCCPSQRTVRTYALDDSGLVLLSEEFPEGAASKSAAETESEPVTFDPAADATVATLNAGALEDGGLDPSIVGVLSGVAGGSRYDATQLGPECTGVIAGAPDVVINWQPEAAARLRFFTLSNGDPTLVVSTPDGSIVCNDDLNPLRLDSQVTIEQPKSGRYAVWVGAFAGEAIAPALLVVTGHDTNAALFDLAAIAPRPSEEAAAVQTLPATTLRMPTDAPAQTIRSTDTPATTELEAGGSIPAYNVDLGNDLCTGFVSEEPTFTFRWAGRAPALGLYFEGEQDSTLIARDPAGAFQCNDDAAGADNLNPLLSLAPLPGFYAVWVGSFAPDVTVPGVLTITTDPNAGPAPLTVDANEGEE